MSEANQQQANSAYEEEEIVSKETSILFTPFMIWCLVACVLVAIWFKFLPLIAVSTFLLMLAVLIVVWKEQSVKNLKLALDLPASRIFAGDDCTIHASVKNDKWLPLIWLEWQFERSDLIVWGDNNRDVYVTRLLWLLWFQQIKWEVKGKAMQRGVYNIGNITVRSGDGFRFTEKAQIYQLNNQLYIYPKLVSVQVQAFRPNVQWDMKGRRGGFLEDPLLINGIREYEPGDEWQRFNWRASARTGKLQTNVYQPVVAEQLVIYIDVQGFVINELKYADEPSKQQKYALKMKESFERFLSIIASTAVAYQKQGMSVGYASNGLNDVGANLDAVPPSKQLTPLLDQMAKMTQHVRRNKIAALEEIVHRRQSAPLFIFCERVTKEHYLWYEQHQHMLDIHFYYLFSNDYSMKLIKVAMQIDCLLNEAAESGL
ncbi:DUF58 domain-containing protein [bacterium LRH843]|nr:DUF58 domain-containing protein [bacterium LRH843]